MDEGSVEAFANDALCVQFLANTDAMDAIKHTLNPGAVDQSQYQAIFYAGGTSSLATTLRVRD